MRTLIMPDVHHRTVKADLILATMPRDRIVWLGDYFDDFYDDDERAATTARWLAARIERDDKNETFLMGNHDFAYHPRVLRPRCAGFAWDKRIAINAVMTPDHWAKIRWTTWVDRWLVSHAGFHPDFLDEAIFPRGKLDDIESVISRDFERTGETSRWFGAGAARGGEQEVGGFLWLDFNDEFVEVPGVPQIVGHTEGHFPRVAGVDHDNHCFDHKLRYIGSVVDGVLTVVDVHDTLGIS